MTTSEKKPRKPADKGIRPQWVYRRYDLVTRKWDWLVPSFTGAQSEPYNVHYDRRERRWKCNCGHFIHRLEEPVSPDEQPPTCKHIDIVLAVIAREKELRESRRACEQKAATSLASVLPKPDHSTASLYSNEGFSLLKK